MGFARADQLQVDACIVRVGEILAFSGSAALSTAFSDEFAVSLRSTTCRRREETSTQSTLTTPDDKSEEAAAIQSREDRVLPTSWVAIIAISLGAVGC